MPTEDGIPTASDVVAHLNERFKARGLSHSIRHIAVLPYMNPMWMANWDVPQLADVAEKEIVDEEIREARWKFPQVEEDY